MKMMFLSYKESMNDTVMEMIDSLGLVSYTRWREIEDRGETGRPRMGSHIWPGYNSALTLVADEQKSAELMTRVRKFNEVTKYEGIKAMCWTLDDACWK